MPSPRAPWTRRALVPGLTLLFGAAAPLAAQTDYYNTDAGRPVLIEDAYPTERYAFELQLAPLRLERVSGGVYNWGGGLHGVRHGQGGAATALPGDEGTEKLLGLVRELVRDTVVQREIRQDPALRKAWQDPGVRRVIQQPQP
jgi:hypothetical protein